MTIPAGCRSKPNATLRTVVVQVRQIASACALPNVEGLWPLGSAPMWPGCWNAEPPQTHAPGLTATN